MWVYVVSVPLDDPWKEEGGAAERLPERVRVREGLAGVPGSVALNVWFPMTVLRLDGCDAREVEVSVRNDMSLLCFESLRGSVTRSGGDDTIEYMLIVSA